MKSSMFELGGLTALAAVLHQAFCPIYNNLQHIHTHHKRNTQEIYTRIPHLKLIFLPEVSQVNVVNDVLMFVPSFPSTSWPNLCV